MTVSASQLEQTLAALLIVACLLVLILLALFITFLVLFLKTRSKLNRYKSGELKAEQVKIIDGVRYTVSDVIANGDEVKVSLSKGDIILKRDEEIVVQKGGVVIPGKYTILAADNTGKPFNVRIGGYVRELTHNTPVVLDEGDTVCPVSHTIVLR